MIPLFDTKRSKKIPYITIFLILLNIVVFFIFKENEAYRFVPGQFNFIHLLTSMFLHANVWHLLVNIWFLWIFGDNVEGKIGHLKFLFFYFLCGIFSAIIYLFLGTNLNVSLMGASGAISGILGGYLILFPKNRLRVFPNFNFYSFVYILLWFLIQLLLVYFGSGEVAYSGHVAGFITGIILVLFFK